MANLQDFRVKRGIVVNNVSTLSGNTAVGSNLAVSGQTVLTGNTTVNGVFTVSNTSNFNGNVAVNSNTLVIDTTNSRVMVNAVSSTVAFYVQGAANVSTVLTTANLVATNINAVSVAANTLSIAGSTNSAFNGSVLFINPLLTRVGINNNAPDASLTITGTANVSGAVAIANTLSVTGNVSLSNTISISGAVTLTSTLNVSSDVTIVNGNVSLSNTSKYFVGSITGQSNTCARGVVAGNYLTGGGALTANVTLNVDATSTATSSKIVARDDSGNFSANAIGCSTLSATTVTASLNGVAASANALYDSTLPTAAYRTVDVSSSASTIPIRNANRSLYANIYYGTAQYANYADLAELYLADKDYPPGTVVTLGGEKEITAATAGQRAIGAISTNPGVLMNQDLEGGIPVALKGRIPVLVSGPVKKGENLVAGPDGTAMVAATRSYDEFAMAIETNLDPLTKLVECLIL